MEHSLFNITGNIHGVFNRIHQVLGIENPRPLWIITYALRGRVLKGLGSSLMGPPYGPPFLKGDPGTTRTSRQRHSAMESQGCGGWGLQGMGMGVGMGVGVEVGSHPRPPQERFYHPTCIKSICHIATLCRSTDELILDV